VERLSLPGTSPGVPDTSSGDTVKIDDWLLEILACPACHAPLREDDAASELVCTNTECALAYPVRDDIPVLLVDEARRPGEPRAAASAEPEGAGE
jgi:uncharacterized protein